jgi:hypothetical protein
VLDPSIVARLQLPQSQPFNPLATLSQLGELKNQALERQYRQQQITDQQTIEAKRIKDQQDQAQLEQLIAMNPDRNTLREAIRTHAPGSLAAFDKSFADLDEKAALAQEHVAATRKSQIEAANALQSYMAGIGAQIAAHDYSPVAFVAGANHLKEQFPELQGQVQAALEQVKSGTPIKTIVDGLMAQNPATQKQFNEAPGQIANSQMAQAKAPVEAAIAMRTMQNPNLFSPTQQSEADARAAAQRTAEFNAQTSRGQLGLAQQKEKREASAADPTDPKIQQRLEQQYRPVLTREISSRSGGLGLEDQKVNQALHLLSIFDQNKDPKTGEYKIPRVLQSELALGLARLISPTGQVGAEIMREVNQRTAKGDLAGLVTYLTGTPVTGNTQDIFKMYKDSIERQGNQAQANREGYFNAIRAMAPTDLEDARRQKLEESLKLNRMPDASSGAIQKPIPGIPGGIAESKDGGKTWTRIK